MLPWYADINKKKPHLLELDGDFCLTLIFFLLFIYGMFQRVVIKPVLLGLQTSWVCWHLQSPEIPVYFVKIKGEKAAGVSTSHNKPFCIKLQCSLCACMRGFSILHCPKAEGKIKKKKSKLSTWLDRKPSWISGLMGLVKIHQD